MDWDTEVGLTEGKRLGLARPAKGRATDVFHSSGKAGDISRT